MNLIPFARDRLARLVASAKRFPLTLFFGAAGAVCGVILASNGIEPDESRLFHVLLACWLSVPVSLAFGLLGEARAFGRWSRAVEYVASLGIAILAWAGFAFTPRPDLPLRFALWFAAAAALVKVTPVFARRDTDAFRRFNLALLQRAFATLALAIPLFLGLLLALWALRALFHLELRDGLEASLWFLVTGVFGTAYFAGGVPRLDAEDASGHPAFLRALTRFLLLPLSCVYLLILYAYVARIVWLREWPQGMVSALILAFAATGIATHLLLQDNPAAGRWGRWYGRRFYLVLAPLVLMLFGAIARRHVEYGLTEQRALVWIAAFWLAGMCAWFLLRRAPRLEAIPLTLGVVAFAVSAGPWSVFELSLASQLGRLERLLTEANRLESGRLVRGANDPGEARAREIAQILLYLERREALSRLEPWFARGDSACARCLTLRDSVPSPLSLATALGLEWAPWAPLPHAEPGERYVRARDAVIDVRGYAFAVPVSLSRWNARPGELTAPEDPRGSDTWRIAGDSTERLVVLRGEDTVTAIDLAGRLPGSAPGARPIEAAVASDSLRFDWSDARGRYSLRVRQARVSAPGKATPKIDHLEGLLLVAPVP